MARVGETVVYKNRAYLTYVTAVVTEVIGAEEVSLSIFAPGRNMELVPSSQYDETGTYWGTWCYPDDLADGIPGVTAPPVPKEA